MTALALNLDRARRACAAWAGLPLMLLALLALLALGQFAATGKAWAQSAPSIDTPALQSKTPPPAEIVPAQDTKPPETKPEEKKTEAKPEEKKPKPSVMNSGDTAWMLTSTALVLLMTIPGVALFYGGMVRKKNVLSVVMHVFAITCLVTVVWVVIGYSLAFSGEGNWVGNAAKAFLRGVGLNELYPPTDSTNAIPETVFVVFQMTFAIITPALIVGAYVDRMKFSAMVPFIVLWSIVVYSTIAHWVWGGGWLADRGALDFAGGTVVHINAGVAGLVCAVMLGKRVGYGTENMAPHNLTLSVVGAALLWVGWFGFNAGSAVAANANAGMAMLVTQLASAVAALTWMFLEWMARGKASILGVISGAIAGLVAITPASGYVGVLGAFVIGIAAGVICYWACTSLQKMFKYDDALDAFGVHAIGGIVGALLTGVFATKAIKGGDDAVGWIDGNAAQMIPQIYGVVATVVFTAAATAVILLIVKAIVGLRVGVDQEREGLDLAEHGETVH
jgi:Amt family ammonium transporter